MVVRGATVLLAAVLFSTKIAGCGQDFSPHIDPWVINAVTLTFKPEGRGLPVVALFDDADREGGAAPMVDTISLAPGNYDLVVEFSNTGVLMLTLRHMPPLSSGKVKNATGPETVKMRGFASIGGATDIQVSFNTNVL